MYQKLFIFLARLFYGVETQVELKDSLGVNGYAES